MQALYELIEEYFALKKLEYKHSNDQYVLKICPACGDDKFHHFYMAKDSGLWDCKKCQQKGNLNQFRNFFGDNSIDLGQYDILLPSESEKEYRELDGEAAQDNGARLWTSRDDMQKYLMEERGLSREILERFKIGVHQDGRIAIPLYENGLLVNFRYRKDPKEVSDVPKYTTEKGCKSVLFNGDILQKENLNNVILTEGEFDAMKLIDEGFTNTVSITLGAGSFPEHWKDCFKKVKTIYIAFDADDAGRKGAMKVAEALGTYRCKLIEIPCPEKQKKTDITEYFMRDGGDKAKFIGLIEKAKYASGVDEDAIKHISEFSDELREKLLSKEYFGEKTGFEQFDEIMGGLRKGRLIILSGLTNCGKTSYSLNIGLNLADRKIPVYFFSLEMPPMDIAKKAMMLKAKLTNTDLKTIADPSSVLSTVDSMLSSFTPEDLPMYLYNGSGEVKIDNLLQTARLAVEKYGVKCIIVDHLHYFVQNYGNLTAETAKLVRQVKQLATSLEVPIILLAHLNRGGRQQKRKGLYIPALSDLRDSGSIEQDADQVIFVCRDSESDSEEDREKTVIKLAKNRDGMAGRSVSMKFIEGYGAFIEVVGGTNYEEEAKAESKARSSEVEIPETIIGGETSLLDELPF